ncbi:NUDIX hydrolase [Pseudohalocynthiibacter aestuariivivens]|nr:NUDIX hydrolase [Pseudohalocynthiibacter aestuariivivens]QIE47313.1 NUDIX hydrolase [Pseudohalocynthiibacter aestuariivivens]
MIRFLSAAWGDYVRPMFQRPKRLQVAALCHRGVGDNAEVLLVTSRGTGRWIIPKGWPIRGLNSPEAALQEAWEEAGVRGIAANDGPIGSYSYDKIMSAGLAVPVETLVYSVSVDEIETRFPEAHERRRQWMKPRVAAELVNEPELKSILRDMT